MLATRVKTLYSGWQGRQTGIGRRGAGEGGEGVVGVRYLAGSAKPALTKKGVLTVCCLIGDNHTFCIHPSLIARQKINSLTKIT